MTTFDEDYCLEPEQGTCNPSDGTHIVYRPKTTKCKGEEAKFVFNRDTGKLVHKCSKKPACLKDGKTAYRTEFIISSQCPEPVNSKHITRTYCKSNLITHPSLQTTLERRWYDVKTLRRRPYNVVLMFNLFFLTTCSKMKTKQKKWILSRYE